MLGLLLTEGSQGLGTVLLSCLGDSDQSGGSFGRDGALSLRTDHSKDGVVVAA